MKLLRLTSIALLLVSMLAGISCKNNDDGGVNPGDSCKISYKVAGQSASETPTICAYLDETLNIGLIGSNSIQFQIINLTNTGEYPFNSGDVFIAIDMSDGTRIAAGNGTVTVSTLNNSRAKGSFSGSFFALDDVNMTNPIQVTDGSFDANY